MKIRGLKIGPLFLCGFTMLEGVLLALFTGISYVSGFERKLDKSAFRVYIRKHKEKVLITDG